MSRPNDETFRIRARALLEEQGAARLARRYGVSEGTIRNYAAGRTTPRDAAVMRNMTRAGRRITGAAIQIRDTRTGRFGVTIADPNVVRYVEVQRDRIQNSRRIAIEEATTPSGRARAESMPTEVDFDLVLDLQRRRQDLLRRRVGGLQLLDSEGNAINTDYTNEDLEAIAEAGGLEEYDYWARWRTDLEASYGRI
tara:strand:- start:9 stop:596 length:588 start_codon:yes stop_codon:yes gene_type:complete